MKKRIKARSIVFPMLPQNGFTLIELLVVIAIVGIIAVGIVATINPAAQFQKTRNTIRKASLRQIANALDRYRLAYGTYPVVGTWCGASTSYWAGGCADPANYIPGLISSGEMKSLPQDPLVGKAFAPCGDPGAASFIYYSNGVDYKVSDYCGMEGTPPSAASDPFVDPVRTSCCWAIYTPGASSW